MAQDSVVLEKRFIPGGTVIIKEGDEGDCAYLIQSGKVNVYTHVKDERVQIAMLGPGQIFGELALIFDDPRTASVEAIEDCNLIVLSRQVLKQKLQKSDPTVQAIVEMLTKRMIGMSNSYLKEKDSVDDMVDALRGMYQNVLNSLPSDQQNSFQETASPQLEALLKTLQDFVPEK